MPRDPRSELTEDERKRLDAGYHDDVARQLRGRNRSDLAGWVLAQIWDFDGAAECYLEAGDRLAALRMALESSRPQTFDGVLRALEHHARNRPDERRAAVAELERRGRHLDAARLLEQGDDDPAAQAESLLMAGDRLAAARVLAEAQRPRDALEILAPEDTSGPRERIHALAARLCWDLGDAEGAARHAQAALRLGHDDAELVSLLARALGSLGHDLAAQLVLQGRDAEAKGAGLPGRYRVTGPLSASLAGAAYVGYDRVTLQEVEIHLLLAELDTVGLDAATSTALDRFAATAQAAASIGHPAIRPIIRIDPDVGLLVMPQAEGPSLRTLIRPPGMASGPSRARALVAFLLEGLLAGHARGLVHGSLLPSQIVSDALGRPLLGPFGAHWISGLAATRTGGLEELLAMTAPELRGGAPPTVASDIYALGAILRALLAGSVEPSDDVPEGAEVDLAREMTAPAPENRPEPRAVLARLRSTVADVRELGTAEAWGSKTSSSSDRSGATMGGIEVQPAETWTNEVLDALCAHATPWMQPIIDRRERTFVLAPWPQGARGLDAGTDEGWRDLVPTEAFEGRPEAARRALEARLSPTSVVATPSGDWMLALDDLLSR